MWKIGFLGHTLTFWWEKPSVGLCHDAPSVQATGNHKRWGYPSPHHNGLEKTHPMFPAWTQQDKLGVLKNSYTIWKKKGWPWQCSLEFHRQCGLTFLVRKKGRSLFFLLEGLNLYTKFHPQFHLNSGQTSPAFFTRNNLLRQFCSFPSLLEWGLHSWKPGIYKRLFKVLLSSLMLNAWLCDWRNDCITLLFMRCRW